MQTSEHVILPKIDQIQTSIDFAKKINPPPNKDNPELNKTISALKAAGNDLDKKFKSYQDTITEYNKAIEQAKTIININKVLANTTNNKAQRIKEIKQILTNSTLDPNTQTTINTAALNNDDQKFTTVLGKIHHTLLQEAITLSKKKESTPLEKAITKCEAASTALNNLILLQDPIASKLASLNLKASQQNSLRTRFLKRFSTDQNESNNTLKILDQKIKAYCNAVVLDKTNEYSETKLNIPEKATLEYTLKDLNDYITTAHQKSIEAEKKNLFPSSLTQTLKTVANITRMNEEPNRISPPVQNNNEQTNKSKRPR